MPTTRTRKARTSKLSAEAAAWVELPDAVEFFERTDHYARRSGRHDVEHLPGVRPWWNPLAWVWLHHTTGIEIPHARNYPETLEFVQALHAQYLASKGKSE